MKKLFFILISSISIATAQNFTGTLTYSNTDTGEVMKYFLPYIPSSYEVYFSGTNVGTKFYGGMFNQVRFSYTTTKNEARIFIDSLKVYTIITSEEATQKKEIVEKLDETEVILGHTCTKYKIQEDDSVYTNTYYVWVAPDMLIANSSILSEVGGESFLRSIPYAVLKMITVAGLHYEVTKISTSTPDPDLFKKPKGYRLEKKLFRKAEDTEDKNKK
jgi:hypothetical protein